MVKTHPCPQEPPTKMRNTQVLSSEPPPIQNEGNLDLEEEEAYPILSELGKGQQGSTVFAEITSPNLSGPHHLTQPVLSHQDLWICGQEPDRVPGECMPPVRRV